MGSVRNRILGGPVVPVTALAGSRQAHPFQQVDTELVNDTDPLASGAVHGGSCS
jgi:hypothetical protein